MNFIFFLLKYHFIWYYYEILHEYSLKPKLHIDINFMYIYYVDFCVISKNRCPDTFVQGMYVGYKIKYLIDHQSEKLNYLHWVYYSMHYTYIFKIPCHFLDIGEREIIFLLFKLFDFSKRTLINSEIIGFISNLSYGKSKIPQIIFLIFW